LYRNFWNILAITAGLLVLGVLDGQEYHVGRTIDLGRIGVHRTGHHDLFLVVGAHVELAARCVPAQCHRMARHLKEGGDRRTD